MSGNSKVSIFIEVAIALIPLVVLVVACLAWGSPQYLIGSAEISFAATVLALLACVRSIESFSGSFPPIKISAFVLGIVILVVFPNTIMLIRVVVAHLNHESELPVVLFIFQLGGLLMALISAFLVAEISKRLHKAVH